MLEADFIEYCWHTLTELGYPLPAQREIMALGFRRHMMTAFLEAVDYLNPVEYAQFQTLRNVLEAYHEGSTNERDAVVADNAVQIDDNQPEIDAHDNAEEAPMNIEDQGHQDDVAANEAADDLVVAPVEEEVPGSPKSPNVVIRAGTPDDGEAVRALKPQEMEYAVGDVNGSEGVSMELHAAPEDAGANPTGVVEEQEDLGANSEEVANEPEKVEQEKPQAVQDLQPHAMEAFVDDVPDSPKSAWDNQVAPGGAKTTGVGEEQMEVGNDPGEVSGGSEKLEQEDVGAQQEETDSEKMEVDNVPNDVENQELGEEKLAQNLDKAAITGLTEHAVEFSQPAVLETPNVLVSGEVENATSHQDKHPATPPIIESLSTNVDGNIDEQTGGVEKNLEMNSEIPRIVEPNASAEELQASEPAQIHADHLPAQQNSVDDEVLVPQNDEETLDNSKTVYFSKAGSPTRTLDAADATVLVPRTSSPVGDPSSDLDSCVDAENDSDANCQQENDCSEETMAGIGTELDQATVEDVKDVLFGIINSVVRRETTASYNYRKCLIDKREALENPAQLQGTLQEQLKAAQDHFNGSKVANDPYLSKIVSSFDGHIWNPSTDPQQPFPHLKNLAAPCTKKMYAAWNEAVNGVISKVSNEEFMKWKHAATAEYHQWEELKGAVDHFIIDQIRLGITTGNMEQKSRKKRQADNGGDAGPAKKRVKTVEDKDSEEEQGSSSRGVDSRPAKAKKRARRTTDDNDKTGSSGAGPSKKEKVEKMRQRYANLNN